MHLAIDLIAAVDHETGPASDLQTLGVLPTCGNLHPVVGQVVGAGPKGMEACLPFQSVARYIFSGRTAVGVTGKLIGKIRDHLPSKDRIGS